MSQLEKLLLQLEKSEGELALLKGQIEVLSLCGNTTLQEHVRLAEEFSKLAQSFKILLLDNRMEA